MLLLCVEMRAGRGVPGRRTSVQDFGLINGQIHQLTAWSRNVTRETCSETVSPKKGLKYPKRADGTRAGGSRSHCARCYGRHACVLALRAAVGSASLSSAHHTTRGYSFRWGYFSAQRAPHPLRLQFGWHRPREHVDQADASLGAWRVGADGGGECASGAAVAGADAEHGRKRAPFPLGYKAVLPVTRLPACHLLAIPSEQLTRAVESCSTKPATLQLLMTLGTCILRDR